MFCKHHILVAHGDRASHHYILKLILLLHRYCWSVSGHYARSNLKLSDQKEDLKGPISCEQRKIISSTRMMKMTGHLQTVKDELFEYRETKAFKTSKINMKKPYEAHQLFVG